MVAFAVCDRCLQATHSIRKGKISLNRQDFVTWINRVYATGEFELDCDQVQLILPAYAEAEFNGDAVGSLAADLETHLGQCPDCTETYQGLHFLLAAEASGDLDLLQGATMSAAGPETHAKTKHLDTVPAG